MTTYVDIWKGTDLAVRQALANLFEVNRRWVVFGLELDEACTFLHDRQFPIDLDVPTLQTIFECVDTDSDEPPTWSPGDGGAGGTHTWNDVNNLANRIRSLAKCRFESVASAFADLGALHGRLMPDDDDDDDNPWTNFFDGDF